MAQEETINDYAKSLELPSILRNVRHARRFALDIGGSLAKLAYCSTSKRKTTRVLETMNHTLYKVEETEEIVEVLNFVKFETKYIESCLNFIQQNLMKHRVERMAGKIIKITGGGAYKYKDLISSKLGCQIDKEDEMDCLITGCNFLLRQICDEAFVYQRHPEAGQSQYLFQPRACELFPYLLVNIGSGVSILKVESETKYTRIGGTSMGGGTFWGLGAMLTKASSFDELLRFAASGNHANVDLSVMDIYGKQGISTLGLPGDLLACSLGKVTKAFDDPERTYQAADCVQSLLFFISNDIAQMACLHANLHNVKRIYFGGFFIRGHPLTMHSISYAISYWSQGQILALFLRHEGYLGAIGAYLKGGEEEDTEKYSWGESYTGSSGLTSPRIETNTNMFEAFQISKHPSALVTFPLLVEPSSYQPDSLDLTQDQEARSYWLNCFSASIDKFVEIAIKSQEGSLNVLERSSALKNEYLTILSNLSTNPTAYGSLTVRSLLDMREQCLRNAEFTDIYLRSKQRENEEALEIFPSRIKTLDEVHGAERWYELARGLLAGNMFDWGAKAVSEMLEKGSLNFAGALAKLEARPWLCDNLDAFVQRCELGPAYKSVAIFCDNSGADIILGVIPLARELLRMNTTVVLCANSEPVVNDVTCSELNILVKRLAICCDIISSGLKRKKLLVLETGQASPCLDFRYVDWNLCRTLEEHETDLVIIVGMGRAVHTNYSTALTCEALKVAVIKNDWLARRLGGHMFSVVFKYETIKSSDRYVCSRISVRS